MTALFRSIRFRMALVYSAVVFGLTALVYLGVYAGLALRSDPPLPPDWRAGLLRETVAALDAYRTAVAQWHRTAWQQIQQQATRPAPGQ